MLVTQSRPRVLRWYHAGPLLFGDWGTSRLYVLGLAFYFTGHASPIFLAVMSAIMIVVAWAYTVACRCFPDGGGVYSAARPINRTFAVVGTTLLLCDYIVTASLSAVEGFHYFHAPDGWVLPLCLVTIVLIGGVNWLGARSAGRLAIIIAVAALAASGLIGVLALPRAAEGLQNVSLGDPSIQGWWTRWESLVRIVLALSGIEAVANMTGLMTKPVERTAKRTIWPVLIEVIVLNMIFVLALSAHPALQGVTVPDHITYEVQQGVTSAAIPENVQAYRDTAMHLVAEDAGTGVFGADGARIFARITSIIFGLLLLSAVNTAIMAMVSVLYGMAHDRELPHSLTKLNYSGVPWIGLIVACIAPMVVLMFMSDAKALSELYAIGVVGAIAIEMISIGINKTLPIKPYERWGIRILGGFMVLAELTIIVVKPNATLFAGVLIVTVLGLRFVAKRTARVQAADDALPVPKAGWLAEVQGASERIDASKPRIMLAARGRYQAEFAVDLARKRGATLFTIYVRTLRLMDVTPGAVPRVEDDPSALESLGTAAVIAKRAGVAFVPIYVSSPEIAEEILDYTVTYGCDTLIMGKTKRSIFARKLEGDVVTRVASMLPSEVALITREATPYEPTLGPPILKPGKAASEDDDAAPPT